MDANAYFNSHNDHAVTGDDNVEISRSDYPAQKRTPSGSEKIVKSLDVSNPPAMFQILSKKHTNLNKPPSNWLHGSSRLQSHIHQRTFPFENFFSSLSMANQFLDLTGVVDVISDSKNIKKLLKMTLSKANVSMLVHRVNNTLLLDNFDIHSLLKQKTGTWELFRKFYFETVAEDVKLPVVERKNKSRDYLQSQNMFSKLLYYCMEDEQPDSHPNIAESDSDSNLLSQKTVLWNFEDITMLIGTDLPIFGGETHPCVSLKLRDMRKPINVLTGLDNWLDNLMCNVPDLAMCYHDNGIIQSYELLKTEDIPNCPDGKFSPNVITDIAQNILSFLKSNATKEGHTYWLFKAHGGDIVKLYDLTTLCNDDNNKDGESHENPFTIPVGILFYRLARNLRVRQVCTSVGKKAKVIKKLLHNSLLLLDPCKHYQIIASCHYFLSDLSVCDHLDEEPADLQNDESDLDFSHSESSDEESSKGSKKRDSHLTKGATSSIKVEALTVHRKSGKKKGHAGKKKEATVKKEDEKVEENIYEKSAESLKHISKAFQNVEKFRLSSDSKSMNKNGSSESRPFEELAQCNPNEAIPLHYSPLNSTTSLKCNQDGPQSAENESKSCREVCENKYSLAKSLRDIESPFSNTSLESSHWTTISKVFLLRKAAVVLVKRAELKLSKSEVLHASVKHDVFNAVKCFCAFSKMIESTFPAFGSSRTENKALVAEVFERRCRYDPFLFSFIARVLGDVYLKYAIGSNKMEEDDRIPSEEEQSILDLAESLNSNRDYPISFKVPTNKGDCFAQSLSFYDLSEAIVENYNIFPTNISKKNAENHGLPKFLVELLRRKANASNEYGKHFMHQIVQEDGSLNDEWPKMVGSAQDRYRESFKIFKLLNDKINAAIVLLNEVNCIKNSAKLMRKRLPPGEENMFTDEERIAYQHAEAYCLEGLDLIENRRKHKDLWETFTWELSSIFIDVGSLIQDEISDGKYCRESVKEMIGQFEKALKFCSFEKGSSRYIPAQYRKGHIHHRLAAFFLSQATSKNKNLRKNDFAEAIKHYELSYDVLSSIKAGIELVGLQLERIILIETMTGHVGAWADVIEILRQCLDPTEIMVETLHDVHEKLSKKLNASPSGPAALGIDDFVSDLRNICESLKLGNRLQGKLSSTLLLLVKECRAKKGEEERFQKLKFIYNRCLSSCALSFKWIAELNMWQELSNTVASAKRIVVSNEDTFEASDTYHFDGPLDKEIEAKDFKNMNIKGTSIVPLPKIGAIVEACSSLCTILRELKSDAILPKYKIIK